MGNLGYDSLKNLGIFNFYSFKQGRGGLLFIVDSQFVNWLMYWTLENPLFCFFFHI